MQGFCVPTSRQWELQLALHMALLLGLSLQLAGLCCLSCQKAAQLDWLVITSQSFCGFGEDIAPVKGLGTVPGLYTNPWMSALFNLHPVSLHSPFVWPRAGVMSLPSGLLIQSHSRLMPQTWAHVWQLVAVCFEKDPHPL